MKTRRSYRTHLGPHPNEGARLAWLSLDRLKIDRERLTEQLGLTRGIVSRLLYCDILPNRELSIKLRDALGVPIDAWSERPRAAIRLPALKSSPLSKTG